jgi:hypothetical protein
MTLKCSFCNKLYTTFGRLENHLLKIHSNLRVPSQLESHAEPTPSPLNTSQLSTGTSEHRFGSELQDDSSFRSNIELENSAFPTFSRYNIRRLPLSTHQQLGDVIPEDYDFDAADPLSLHPRSPVGSNVDSDNELENEEINDYTSEVNENQRNTVD